MEKQSRLVRLREILGDPHAEPPIPAMFPVCKSTWWSGIKSGRYPAPIKLSERCTAWKLSDLLDWIEQQRTVGQAAPPAAGAPAAPPTAPGTGGGAA